MNREYPRNVYKAPDVIHSVANEDEHAAAMKAGWYATVPEAIARKHAPAADATPAKAPAIAPVLPPDVVATLADLKKKAIGGDVKALKEYAAAAGITVPQKADAAAMYEVIEKALSTPPA